MRSLAPLFPEKSNLPEPIGEVWLTGVDCKIATGPFAGITLGEAWKEMPAEWRGTHFTKPSDFPILIKFLFPNDKLSIQVHPDDAYAAAHEKAAGGRGKTEMWHILSADSPAQVLVGLKPGVTKESFLKALDNHTLEDLFQHHTVHAGDTYFVPARTPHTIGPGMVICEIQEYSDLTYRVYDYGRVDALGKPRELHIDKALGVIDFQTRPVEPFRRDVPMDEFGMAYIFYLAACPYFLAEKCVGGPVRTSTESPRFELITVIKGSGEIRWRGAECAYALGETWFLPASLGKYELIPSRGDAEILRIYVPDLVAFENKMKAKGYSQEERERFIFGD
jgi:mannose-6-phosphate isomerase